MKLFLLSTLICISTNRAIAQMAPIETDRPDQTESAFTVPQKWVQLEMGFLQQSDRNTVTMPKDFHFHHPALLAKYGLAANTELRLITEWATAKEKTSTGWHRYTGISSLQLGGKIHFFDEKGWRPKTSLIAHYDFGRWRTLYRDNKDGFNFRFTMQHSLGNIVSLSYNLGMRWDRFGYPPASIYTLAPGFNIGNRWYAYAEVFGFVWQNETPENSFDAGVAYNINEHFKVDISAGLGINKKAPDNYFAIGASFRFKTIRSTIY